MRTLLFLLFTPLLLCAQAQPFKIVSATSQGWAGGQAGRSGCRYSIVLEATDTTIVPDTLWIAKTPYPLNFKKSTYCSKLYNKKRRVMTYYLNPSENHYQRLNYNTGDDFAIKKETKKKDTIAVVKQPVKQFDGAALITYMYKGAQCSVIIKQFKTLPSLNYP